MTDADNRPKGTAKPRAARRPENAPIADTAESAKRTPPPNARVIQDSHKTGTVTRAAARAAAERASGMV